MMRCPAVLDQRRCWLGRHATNRETRIAVSFRRGPNAIRYRDSAQRVSATGPRLVRTAGQPTRTPGVAAGLFVWPHKDGLDSDARANFLSPTGLPNRYPWTRPKPISVAAAKGATGYTP